MECEQEILRVQIFLTNEGYKAKGNKVVYNFTQMCNVLFNLMMHAQKNSVQAAETPAVRAAADSMLVHLKSI